MHFLLPEHTLLQLEPVNACTPGKVSHTQWPSILTLCQQVAFWVLFLPSTRVGSSLTYGERNETIPGHHFLVFTWWLLHVHLLKHYLPAVSFYIRWTYVTDCIHFQWGFPTNDIHHTVTLTRLRAYSFAVSSSVCLIFRRIDTWTVSWMNYLGNSIYNHVHKGYCCVRWHISSYHRCVVVIFRYGLNNFECLPITRARCCQSSGE